MEIRDLFGDGEPTGDLIRKACLCDSTKPLVVLPTCVVHPQISVACESRVKGAECIVRIDPTAQGLPREVVCDAIRRGSDIVLDFPAGGVPPESMMREVANLVRRLRTSGLTITLSGLATSVRARISRLEASLGRI